MTTESKPEVPVSVANNACSKCQGKTDLTDIKIANQDLGKLCSNCYKEFQEGVIGHFKNFVQKIKK